jgi:CRP-like cAMP-binding protein
MNRFTIILYHLLQMEDFSEKSLLIEPCNANCSFCFLNYTEILEKNYLFRHLTREEIGIVIREVHHQVHSYSKGTLIASSGEMYNNLMIIVKGAVVGELIDFEGRVLRIEELRAPDTIATAFIFGDNNQLPVNITTIDDTRLLTIPRTDLIRLLKRNEQVLHNYLNIMANRAQYLSKKIRLLGLQSIKGKIAHYLLELEKKSISHEILLPNTQREIADMFGVTRPSIGRVFREMDFEGLIHARGKKVKIINKQGLSKLLR